jgi:hypothetical protein
MKPKRRLRIPEISIPLWWPSLPIDWRLWLPTRGNVLFTVLVLSALVWAGNAGAFPLNAPAAASTSTGTVAYQGRLADASGNPVTATVPMIFRLYGAASGGTPLWEEQWTGPSSVRVSDGLFNVMLGSLTAIPQSVVTGNSNLWLGITVNTDNEMQPRVQLGSVPFAVQALTVPDSSISTAKIADGSVTAAKLDPSALFSENVYTLTLPAPVLTTSTANASFGTINLPAASNVYVMGQWLLRNSSTDAGIRANLEIDGTSYALSGDFFSLDGSGVATTVFTNYYIPNLSAGTHSVSVRIGQGPFETNNSVGILNDTKPSTIWIRAVPVRP